MSTSSFLIRLREPLPVQRIPIEQGTDVEAMTLPFGALDALTGRLLSLPGFRREAPLNESVVAEARARMGAKSALLPAVSLHYAGGPAEATVSLLGDPVDSIAMERSGPWSLLPIADLLSDLGPFAIFCDDATELLDPEQFRETVPHAGRPLVSRAEPAAAEGPAGLRTLWSVEIPGGPVLSLQISEAGDFLVARHGGGAITCLEARTGKALWSRTWDRGGPVLALAGELALLAGDHSEAFAFSLANGELRWRAEVKGWVHSRPTAVATRLIAVACQLSGDLTEIAALRLEDGRREWTLPVKRSGIHVLCGAGEHLIASIGDEVRCLDAKTGEVEGLHELEPESVGKCLMSSCARDITCLGSHAYVLDSRSLLQLPLPAFRPAHVAERIPANRSHEGFLEPLGPETVLAALPALERGVVLRALAVPSLAVRYEIALEARPARPVAFGPRRWATVVRRGESAALIVADSLTGAIVRRDPWRLGDAYLDEPVAGQGMVYAGWGGRDAAGDRSGIVAFTLSPREDP